jgi:Alpha-kinase family
LTFSELVKSSHENILSDSISTLGDLTFNPLSKPQLGSFKKAQFGRMNDLTTRESQPVCIKQCIRREQHADTFKSSIMVYDSRKQAELLTMEINCTRWAAALMGVVYDFIVAESRTRGRPPFKIPKMKFVSVALAIAQNDKRDTYLIEDVIDTAGEGEFIKYINNNSAKPLVFHDNEERTGIAAFLAFAQHVQYYKTQQLAFVSDFQGRDEHFLSTTHH